MPIHRVFGLSLASDFPLGYRLLPGVPPAGLTLDVEAAAPPEPVSVEPTYESPLLGAQGESVVRLYRLAGRDLLRFPGEADFVLGRQRVVARPFGPLGEELLDLRLFGTVLAYWLERAGFPALHAAAVAVEGSAVAFLAANRGGKSSLAASLMEVGCPLLTDDILPLEEPADGSGGTWLGRSGYPQMRFWPDEAERFFGTAEGLPRVHPAVDKRRVPVGEGGFGAFDGAARPLRCLYLPERRPAGEVTIQRLSPRDAVMELVRCSFLARLVEAAGWQPRRLDLFVRLARDVPAFRLVYPEGFEHLPRVRRAVLEHLAST